MPFLLGAVVLVVALTIPDNAFAWGPATHLRMGFEVLDNLAFLSGQIRDLIRQFPFDYLYGLIAADITTAKRLAAAHWHCHSWRVGYRVLEEARTDAQRSFSHGYLSHLAADIVSHNLYVPRKILASYPAVTLNHVYWEMRFDAFVEREYWKVAHRVARLASKDDDDLIERVVQRPIFSFRTNKRIFSGVMRNYRGQSWRKVLNRMAEVSQWSLTEEEFEAYYSLALGRVMEYLWNGPAAACLKEDPTGTEIIRTALKLSKRLRVLDRRGIAVNRLVRQTLDLPGSRRPEGGL